MDAFGEPSHGPSGLIDPTIDETLIVYAAALRRHQQHLDDGYDQRAWHVLARPLMYRAVWSANNADEVVGDGRPLPWNPKRVEAE